MSALGMKFFRSCPSKCCTTWQSGIKSQQPFLYHRAKLGRFKSQLYFRFLAAWATNKRDTIGRTAQNFLMLQKQSGEKTQKLYFINFELVIPKKEVVSDTLLNALCSFQFHHGTEKELTFTVLDSKQGLAFSQRYKKTSPGQCWHSHMWKHLPSVENPDSPSFDVLAAQSGEKNAPSMAERLRKRSTPARVSTYDGGCVERMVD